MAGVNPQSQYYSNSLGYQHLLLGSATVQLLTLLLEAGDYSLTFLANEPLGELGSLLSVGSLLSDQQVGWVKEKVIGLVGASLVDDSLVPQLLI